MAFTDEQLRAPGGENYPNSTKLPAHISDVPIGEAGRQNRVESIPAPARRSALMDSDDAFEKGRRLMIYLAQCHEDGRLLLGDGLSSAIKDFKIQMQEIRHLVGDRPITIYVSLMQSIRRERVLTRLGAILLGAAAHEMILADIERSNRCGHAEAAAGEREK